MTKRLIGTRHGVLAVLGTVLALSLSAPAHAVPAGSADLMSAPDEITVEVVAANGSGCSPGTARVAAYPDKTGFRVRYYDFVATAGNGVDVTSSRKNCQLGVLVKVPAGWTFAVAAADYRGRARVPAGATGRQRTNYYWQGSSDNSRTEETFGGPYNGFWATLDAAPVLVYVPCGQQRVLNINTELRVDAGSSGERASMSMTTTEGDVDTLFNLEWQRC
ncbi:DUF4360 domain-containing protein [Solwaraspora sp. WMMD1047]|uniref:DUF4360 domain-containing protein n=1 Tax=Solwaraspora sp. WMMD1047 TaxID=3016102 RepID=UPI002416C8D1|nr:DUF4360 domain-containing protein [Solwaraspora sp. WMMD1047]MDG4832934.1 DUF4360 domain-containing protein [Solwaraspora sp. WMMD1047]